MVAATKFQTFVSDMAAGYHVNALNAQSDTLNVALLDTEPSASADTVFANVTGDQPTGTDYAIKDVINTAATSGGTITVDGDNAVWTAGAADWTGFQWVVLYNDTPTSPADPLIMYWDYGSTVNLGNGETFTFNITTNLFTVT